MARLKTLSDSTWQGRRDFMRQVITGLGVWNLSDLFRLRDLAASESSHQDTSLILLWQDGGPSHFETFDPKPDAPTEIRGPYKPISTCLPGIQFCENMPKLAQMADRFSIIRSLHQASSAHVSASHTVITGYDRTGVIKGPPDYPDLGAVIHKMRRTFEKRLPEYVALGSDDRLGVTRGGTAHLGPAYAPFGVLGDPSDPKFKVKHLYPIDGITSERFKQRVQLVDEFDTFRRRVNSSAQMEAMNEFQQQAIGLITGGAAAKAFDLEDEDPVLRDRYGRCLAGQQALMSRRLVEAGVSIVAARFVPLGTGDEMVRKHNNWDDHAVNVDIFRVCKQRDPQMDQAVSALIEDLENRGLNKKVLVVLLGEFGRTPRITYRNGRPGRDHWGPAGNALVYGGGFNMGQVIGSTNVRGEHPVERPLKPQDLLATIYYHLGIDPSHELEDPLGRPVRIMPYGDPIRELVGTV